GAALAEAAPRRAFDRLRPAAEADERMEAARLAEQAVGEHAGGELGGEDGGSGHRRSVERSAGEGAARDVQAAREARPGSAIILARTKEADSTRCPPL